MILAFLFIFLMTGCSLENLSPTHFFNNIFPKHTKEIVVPSGKTNKTKPTISHGSFHQKRAHATKRKRRPHPVKIQKLSKTYLYYLHSASLPELRHYLDSGKAAEDLPLEKYTLLRERRKGMEEDALIQYGSLKELIAAYDKTKNPRYKARILTLMKQKEKEDSQ